MSIKKKALILRILLGVSVLIFFVTLFFGLGMLSKKSKSLSKLRLDDSITKAQLDSLTQAKAEVEKYGYYQSIAKAVIPNDKDQAQAVVDIFTIADLAGLSLQTLTFPNSTLGVSGSGGVTSSAVPESKSILSQAKPVTGITGLYSIEVILSPENTTQTPDNKKPTYPKMLDFLERIEKNQRTAQITALNIEPIDGSDKINFSLTLNIFIKP